MGREAEPVGVAKNIGMTIRIMDETEQRVADYFASQGYSQIVFEPDGNIPPDFCLNGSVAIEVRRLNQTFDDEGLTQRSPVITSASSAVTALTICAAGDSSRTASSNQPTASVNRVATVRRHAIWI
jgi:hypothetical protein